MSELQCPATVLFTRSAEAEPRGLSRGGGRLTDTGREQAAALARRLARRSVAHVWTSPTVHAVQTAEIVAAALGVGITTRRQLRDTGDEPRVDLLQRFSSALEEVADQHRGETVLVVSHGRLLRLCLPALFRSAPGVRPAALDHTAVVETSCADDRVITAWTLPPAGRGGKDAAQ